MLTITTHEKVKWMKLGHLVVNFCPLNLIIALLITFLVYTYLEKNKPLLYAYYDTYTSNNMPFHTHVGLFMA